MNISLRSNEGDTVEFEVAGPVDHHDLAQSTDILTELVGEDVVEIAGCVSRMTRGVHDQSAVE